MCVYFIYVMYNIYVSVCVVEVYYMVCVENARIHGGSRLLDDAILCKCTRQPKAEPREDSRTGHLAVTSTNSRILLFIIFVVL